jgi:protein-tyrosine phosphatase
MTNPIKRSYWVTQNELLAGEYPGSLDQDETRQKLGALLDAGIRSFVDLTEQHELRPYEPILRELAAECELQIGYRRMSVEDMGIPTLEHMESVLEHIERETRDSRPVYVHCWGGIGRTGTVVGCYLVRHGTTAADALARIAELRRSSPDGHRTSPETDAQRRFVADWKVRT